MIRIYATSGSANQREATDIRKNTRSHYNNELNNTANSLWVSSSSCFTSAQILPGNSSRAKLRINKHHISSDSSSSVGESDMADRRADGRDARGDSAASKPLRSQPIRTVQTPLRHVTREQHQSPTSASSSKRTFSRQ